MWSDTQNYIKDLNEAIQEDREEHEKKPLTAKEEVKAEKEIRHSTTDPESGYSHFPDRLYCGGSLFQLSPPLWLLMAFFRVPPDPLEWLHLNPWYSFGYHSTHLKANANKHKYTRKTIAQDTQNYIKDLNEAIQEDREEHEKKPLTAKEEVKGCAVI